MYATAGAAVGTAIGLAQNVGRDFGFGARSVVTRARHSLEIEASNATRFTYEVAGSCSGLFDSATRTHFFQPFFSSVAQYS
jgi:hypothetical protein